MGGHYATALRAFGNLAKEGRCQAENNIGYLYERGLGVPQDYSKALKWYKLSANKSLPEGNIMPGYYTTTGMGLRRTSQRQGSGSKSSEKGYTEAEYMMGQFFKMVGAFMRMVLRL